MATSKTLTMFEWMFKHNTWADGIVRVGFGGFILASLVTNAVTQVKPSAGITSLICLCIAFLLALPIFLGWSPKDNRLKIPILTLAIAFSLICLLYFFDTFIFKIPSGYDAITDVISTYFFVPAWFILSGIETDKQRQDADRVTIAMLCLLIFIAGASKLVFDIHLLQLRLMGLPVDQTIQDNDNAARLLLNICNGAIFLSLYGQMRRLFPSPDPVTHFIILLFGCAQIAAHGRDCLSPDNRQCHLSSFEELTALAISWVLLLGKIAFGLYVSYLFFNAQITKNVENVQSDTT